MKIYSNRKFDQYPYLMGDSDENLPTPSDAFWLHMSNISRWNVRRVNVYVRPGMYIPENIQWWW